MVSQAWGWIAVVPCLLHFGLAANKYIEDANRFPGWKGELLQDKTGQPKMPDLSESALKGDIGVRLLF